MAIRNVRYKKGHAYLVDYYDASGKRRYKTFRTYQAAKDAEAQFRDAKQQGVVPLDRKITFGDYALSWLDRQVLKPSTYDSYKAILTKHLLPEFGHVPFASLTRPMLKDYLERKQASNQWARQTIHNVRTVLRGIIADAHDSGYVTTNIADRLRLKRQQVASVSSWGEKEDMDQHFSPLEWEEVQHLLAVARKRYPYPYP
jgi:hypothetical protein